MAKLRVLVVEGGDDLRELLVRAFRQEGCEVSAATTGAEALAVFRRAPPHAVLLDLELSDVTGLNILDELRRIGPVPVIVVAGATSPAATAVQALDSGAVDYMRKPVDLRELAARMRVVMRTVAPTESHGRFAAGPLQIDAEEDGARYAGHDLGASATEIRLLRFLAGRPGTIFSKDDLVRALCLGERTLHLMEVHVSNLRRKLRSAGCDQELIRTVPGRGYKFRTPKPGRSQTALPL